MDANTLFSRGAMHKDDWAIMLAVICSVTGAVGTFFTLSIALGFNRHMGRWISNKFGGFNPDYGEPCPAPAPAPATERRRMYQ